MYKQLNDYNYQKYCWKGKPTHCQWTWIAYYDDIDELFNTLINEGIIHDDDINQYIINKYSLEDLEKEANKKEDWQELQDKIENIRCHDMSQDEIVTMIAKQTGNAYYQEFIDLRKEYVKAENNYNEDEL